MQEIALVLGRVHALQEHEAAVALLDARVMPGGDALGAQRDGVIEERLELDLGVAQHVGIGRAPGLVFGEEGREDALAVLGGKVHRLDLDADALGDRDRIDEVLPRGAILVVVVVLPVLHEEADHVVAGALQQERGHGRIDASGEADDDLHRGKGNAGGSFILRVRKSKRRSRGSALPGAGTGLTSSALLSSSRPSWARPSARRLSCRRPSLRLSSWRASSSCRPWRGPRTSPPAWGGGGGRRGGGRAGAGPGGGGAPPRPRRRGRGRHSTPLDPEAA